MHLQDDYKSRIENIREGFPYSYKIKGIHELDDLRDGKPDVSVVATCGNFDVMHIGHRAHLEETARLGYQRLGIDPNDASRCLTFVVGINSDLSIDNSYINIDGKLVQRIRSLPEHLRVRQLAFNPHIDYVVLFDDPDAMDLIKVTRPDLWTKGADYALTKQEAELYGKPLINQDEVKLVESLGGKVALSTVFSFPGGQEIHSYDLIRQRILKILLNKARSLTRSDEIILSSHPKLVEECTLAISNL